MLAMRSLRSFPLLLALSIILKVSAKRTRITWSNGVGYTEKLMQRECKEIAKLFGSDVSYCHNPSAMVNDDDVVGYLNDLIQAGTQKLGRVTMEVNSLVKHMKEAIASVGKNGRVLHIAHSQGALITALAARQLSVMEMSQMEVIAFGGAVALRRTPQTPFHRCVNYYAVNDPLLFVVPSAEQALRSGYVADDEFCFLAPKVGDPVQDHYLLGPTYSQALSWEGRRYQLNNHNIAKRTIFSLSILISSFLDALVEAMVACQVAIQRYTEQSPSPMNTKVRQKLRQHIQKLLEGLQQLAAWLKTEVLRVPP
eukprot:Nitzschia sp. Nitz4//scaffold2_size372955//169321//170314//NITZ4_000419-RA/size372955-snap-gene-0.29-mRNA-1//1//CDS//3329546766//5396//frame0